MLFREDPEWADVEPVSQDDGPDPVVPIAYSSQFEDAMDYFRAVMAADERSPRALSLTAAVIKLNAANYTVWHYRRLVLEAVGGDLEDERDYIDSLADDNPKNYQLWHHRRWVAGKLGPASWTHEMNVTAKVLQDDTKNYHAWAHRQWVLRELGGWEVELDYCTHMIRQDVRNNSAWNQRYYVLTESPSSGGLLLLRTQEVLYAVMVLHQAPSNESPWQYLRGLYQQDRQAMVEEGHALAACVDVLAEKEECVQALSMLLDLLCWGLQPDPRLRETLLLSSADGMEAAAEICSRLEFLDPIRGAYWAYRRTMLASDA
eukprot:jgi/Mesen1/1846/ME000143S00909